MEDRSPETRRRVRFVAPFAVWLGAILLIATVVTVVIFVIWAIGGFGTEGGEGPG